MESEASETMSAVRDGNMRRVLPPRCASAWRRRVSVCGFGLALVACASGGVPQHSKAEARPAPAADPEAMATKSVDGVVMRVSDIDATARCPDAPSPQERARLVVVYEDLVSDVRLVGGAFDLDGESAASLQSVPRSPSSTVVVAQEVAVGCHVLETRVDYLPLVFTPYVHSRRFRMRGVTTVDVPAAGLIVRVSSTECGSVTTPLEKRMQVIVETSPPSPLDGPPFTGSRSPVADAMPTPVACSHLTIPRLRTCAADAELKQARREGDQVTVSCAEKRVARMQQLLEVVESSDAPQREAALQEVARLGQNPCRAYDAIPSYSWLSRLRCR